MLSKTAIHCSSGGFYFRSNVLYITIVANNLTWKYTNEFWGDHRWWASGTRELPRSLNRLHWVRLAGGGPGNCLVGESFLGVIGFGTSFSYFNHRGYNFRTRVRFGLLAVSPQSLILQSFHWLWSSSIQPLGDGVVGGRVGRRGHLVLVSAYRLWIPWTWVDPGVHRSKGNATWFLFYFLF